jgi:large subunit ribosomal protein L25
MFVISHTHCAYTMAELETLAVEARDLVGKRNNRRLRNDGFVPAVLYGHNETAVPLKIEARNLEAALRHGARGLMLSGAVNESAVIQDLQFNTFGTEVLHVDLLRVSRGERIGQSLPLHLHGQAPGLNSGGIIDIMLHEVDVICDPTSIPDHLTIEIGNLQVGQTLHASDITLPEGVELDIDANTAVVQCKKPGGQTEPAPEAAEGAEPAK